MNNGSHSHPAIKSNGGDFLPFVHRVALTASLMTFFLIVLGGLVTSKGAGMSVPDWPTTYGYNMFLFPYSKWVGGIFWEHSHRLIATGIGLISVVLLIAALLQEKRSWVKILATAFFLMVVIQGVIGGKRVTLAWDQLGIFHALLAQTCLGLALVVTAVTGRSFLSGAWFSDKASASLRWMVVAGVVLTYFQLGVAATIRHQHAPLAIPDFPAAYGQLLPNLSPQAITSINATRAAEHIPPVSVLQIVLQLVHRSGAIALLLVVITIAIQTMNITPLGHWMRSWSLLWVGGILLQILLGGITIWSNKAADVATAHMALGALLTGFSILFAFRLFCAAVPSSLPAREEISQGSLSSPSHSLA